MGDRVRDFEYPSPTCALTYNIGVFSERCSHGNQSFLGTLTLTNSIRSGDCAVPPTNTRGPIMTRFLDARA